jgi:asparagine synthetase B (glutamine-hydrolysing)
MCNIAGFSGEADEVWLEKGLHAIARRGPDDWGLCVDERASARLGYRRSAVICFSPAYVG